LPKKTNTLTVGPFEYTITLYDNGKAIKIEIVHLGEFHQWKRIYEGPDVINKPTVPNSMSNSLVAIELTPEILFNIFDDYKNDKLDAKTLIEFPQLYDSAVNPLSIKIINTVTWYKTNEVIEEIIKIWHEITSPISRVEKNVTNLSHSYL